MRAMVAIVLAAALGSTSIGGWSPQTQQTLAIRGHDQQLRVYGSPAGNPVIVSSGDGGWIHLGRHVAEFLSTRGFYVVGFDVRAYLESFTERRATLQAEQAPRDYDVLAQFVRRTTGKKPLLIGVSEGAGLSVLAATDPQTKENVAGVLGLGLPDLNELAWRWKDAVIYLTHRAPDEPTFSTAAVAARVAPVPLAAIHSTHDEFVPLADAQRVLAAAKEPKRLWILDAVDHRFSDNLAQFDRTLLEAIDWIKAHGPA